MTRIDATVDDISRSEERKLEQFKDYYNHENLEEALEDLTDWISDGHKEKFYHDSRGPDVEMAVLYCIADREELEAEDDVTWCAACDDALIVGHATVGNDYGMTRHVEDEGMVCGPCVEHDEMEPLGTVVYNNSDMPHTIGHYHDRTEGDFEVQSTRHDAWRVSHSIKPVDEERWLELNVNDVILSHSRDAEELKEMEDKLMEYADEVGVTMARATGRTSNVFSTTYNLYVDTESGPEEVMLHLKAYAVHLQDLHRDDARFTATALTGKDPEDMDEHDERFVDAVEKMKSNGLGPREAVEEVL